MALDTTQKELIQRSFVESLNEEEVKQLNELLRQSKEAREHYQKAATLDSMLRDHSDTYEEELEEKPSQNFLWWKVAALFFMGLSLLLVANDYLPQSEDTFESNTTHPNLAIVQHAVNLSEEDSSIITDGTSLEKGKLKIDKGLIQIDFISGVSLIGEGPLSLNLHSDMELSCDQGKIRVLVPPQATGFKLLTPDTKVLKPGTEFGVIVSEEGSNISAIDGHIEFHEKDQKEVVLIEGEHLLVKEGTYRKIQQKYKTPSPIDLALAIEQQASAKNEFWLNSLSTIQEDHQLVIYYDFRKKGPWGKILHNLMDPKKSLSYGAIVGANWTDGRLGPETALEFKGNHNFIRLEDNTIYDSMTLLTWARIDSLDVSLSSLLHSDNWSDKAVHWHISNRGSLTFGIKSKYNENTIIRSPDNTINANHLGKWIMIVSTYDGPTGTARQYINGALVDERTDLKTYPGKIGKAQIGGWLSNNKQTGRGLNGRIDRFAVWSKALSAQEIKERFLQGSPNSPLALVQ